jgi:hypothetical protein
MFLETIDSLRGFAMRLHLLSPLMLERLLRLPHSIARFWIPVKLQPKAGDSTTFVTRPFLDAMVLCQQSLTTVRAGDSQGEPKESSKGRASLGTTGGEQPL